jgi:hypothetical protein
MFKRTGLLPVTLFAAVAQARGVSAYLSLNLDPEVQPHVERVMILANEPVITRLARAAATRPLHA